MVDLIFALQTKVIDICAKVLVYTLPTLQQHVGIFRVCRIRGNGERKAGTGTTHRKCLIKSPCNYTGWTG